MKKLKNYILMLLVPLILLGCVSKGVSDAVEDTTDSNLGGYTWAQLQSMIASTSNSSSTLKYNVSILNSWITDLTTAKLTTAAGKVNAVTTYLEDNVKAPINGELTTFNYNTSITKMSTLNDAVIQQLTIYDYDELVKIYEVLSAYYVTYYSDTKLQQICSSLEATINDIKIRKAINPFYSEVYDLYSQYNNNIGESTVITYLATAPYNINLSEIDQSQNIAVALSTLNLEISSLTLNELDFEEQNELLDYMEELKNVYSRYINGTDKTLTNINTKMTELRSYETTLVASSSASNIADYYSWITTVETRVKSANCSTETQIKLRELVLSHIDAYKRKNTYYDSNDSASKLIINSKIVNVLNEIDWLQDKTSELRNTLKISVPWN